MPKSSTTKKKKEHTVWLDKNSKKSSPAIKVRLIWLALTASNTADDVTLRLLSIKVIGGNVLMWGLVSVVGISSLIHLHSQLNVAVYKYHIGHLSASSLVGLIFMQDNASCPSEKEVQLFFEVEKRQ